MHGKSQIPLRYLVRSCFEPDSVMEFGFNWTGPISRDYYLLRHLPAALFSSPFVCPFVCEQDISKRLKVIGIFHVILGRGRLRTRVVDNTRSVNAA